MGCFQVQEQKKKTQCEVAETVGKPVVGQSCS